MAQHHYDRRVSIEHKATTKDPQYGTERVNWRRLAVVWAEVQDMIPSRSEAVRQGLMVARNQVRVRMRYRPDVTSDMRLIVHGDRGDDRVFEIVAGPAVLGRKEALEMVCERWTS